MSIGELPVTDAPVPAVYIPSQQNHRERNEFPTYNSDGLRFTSHGDGNLGRACATTSTSNRAIAGTTGATFNGLNCHNSGVGGCLLNGCGG